MTPGRIMRPGAQTIDENRGTMSSLCNTPRWLAAILASSLLLALGITTASARNLSFSNQTIRVAWSSVEFTSSVIVRCRLTLEGSFHTRTITKVVRSLIGSITRATMDEANCTNGNGRARTETLPWHLTYEGFTGTLPNIDSIFAVISRFRLNMTVPGLCTADYGIATDNITGQAVVGGGSEFTTLTPVTGRNRVTLHSGGAFCPGSAAFGGTGNVTILNSTTRVRITLI